MGINIIKPGMMSSIQDQGRRGFQSLGVSTGGVMDPLAMKLANVMAGNPLDEAVIEMTMTGATFECGEPARIAFFGADMGAVLNGKQIHMGQPMELKKGDVLAFGYAQKGCRCYVAVQGGFDLEPVLGSQSTHLQAKFGGLKGRVLQKGDWLPFKRPLLSDHTRRIRWSFYLSPALSSYLGNRKIRFIPGKQYNWFTEEDRERFLNQSYQISADSNRIGYRLKGEQPLTGMERQELITEGTAAGSIQVPPSGEPIILMADRQPTGGYPRIGEVISVDLPVLAQKKPGDWIRFEPVTLEEAQKLYLLQERELSALKKIVQQKMKE